MRVVAPLCAARLSTTALYAARLASGLSTSTSVRSVGARPGSPLQRLTDPSPGPVNAPLRRPTPSDARSVRWLEQSVGPLDGV